MADVVSAYSSKSLANEANKTSIMEVWVVYGAR